MPGVWFELMIPVLERPKTVRASNRSATGTGRNEKYRKQILEQGNKPYRRQKHAEGECVQNYVKDLKKRRSLK
jgi:hypothetical protein